MVGYICPTHTVSVTYKLGVTAVRMIMHASLLEATEGKRPIAAARKLRQAILAGERSSPCYKSMGWIWIDRLSRC
jgi:hypothetical protein